MLSQPVGDHLRRHRNGHLAGHARQILQQANALNGLSQFADGLPEYGTVRTFSGDLISEASGTSLPPSAPAGQTALFPAFLQVTAGFTLRFCLRLCN